MTAARNFGPAMPSGSCSDGGTCTMPILPGVVIAGSAGGAAGIAPVMSLAGAGAAGTCTCGIGTCALSSRFGAGVWLDCWPIGIGEVIIAGVAGTGNAGAALESFAAG